ncbi:MAG TPA: hypothetical protein VGV64_04025 [Thermoplasmata archaeon]|nr:hypothetical protein [Thermoplasmata archaeon]
MTAWVPTGEFTIGLRPQPTRRITTSRTELIHVGVAFAVLAIDFALLRSSFTFRGALTPPDPSLVVALLPFGAAAALTGFIAHEMAHKVSAQRFGFWAEFRLSPSGLLLSLFTALVGFLFAAPGATVVGGMGDVDEWGKTSLAGPSANLVQGGAFALGAGLAASAHLPSAWIGTLLLLAYFNGWFGAFNLLPFGPLDGRKVYRWSRGVWGLTISIAIAFTVLTFFLSLASP